MCGPLLVTHRGTCTGTYTHHTQAHTHTYTLIFLCLSDTGLLSLTQYILLDPPLICFITASAMTTFKFLDCKDEPFSLEWWWWLTISGCTLAFSIGYCCVCIKSMWTHSTLALIQYTPTLTQAYSTHQHSHKHAVHTNTHTSIQYTPTLTQAYRDLHRLSHATCWSVMDAVLLL